MIIWESSIGEYLYIFFLVALLLTGDKNSELEPLVYRQQRGYPS